MRKKIPKAITILLLWAGVVPWVNAQADEQGVEAFVNDMVRDEGFTEPEVRAVLASAQFQQSTIDKMTRPAEGMPWYRYRRIFMQQDRISAGVDFWKQYEPVLDKASQDTGVPPEIIVGIIGVETFYGQRMGSYRVLDALYTLAFGYPKRSTYFTSELRKLLVLAKAEGLDIYSLKGSYAGAIGYCQFMPSSYEAYAKSYEPGGVRNLMQAEDAIASVANYLKVHRWEAGAPIARQVPYIMDPRPVETKSVRPQNTLRYYSEQGYRPSGNLSPSLKAALLEFELEDGTEYWFGFQNFYVITRYNHSSLYALAVYQLAEAVKERKGK